MRPESVQQVAETEAQLADLERRQEKAKRELEQINQGRAGRVFFLITAIVLTLTGLGAIIGIPLLIITLAAWDKLSTKRHEISTELIDIGDRVSQNRAEQARLRAGLSDNARSGP